MRLRLFALTLLVSLCLAACDNRSHSERMAMQFRFSAYENMPLQAFLGDYGDVLHSHAALVDTAACLTGWKLEFGEREVSVKVSFNIPAEDSLPCDSAYAWHIDDVRRYPVAGFEVLDVKHDRIVYLTGAD